MLLKHITEDRLTGCEYIYDTELHELSYRWLGSEHWQKYFLDHGIWTGVDSPDTPLEPGRWSNDYPSVSKESVGDEIFEALIAYSIERWDAQYFARKCIQIIDGLGYHHFFMKDVRLLASFRDTGLESLYMIDPVWVRVRIKPEKKSSWCRFTPAQKKACINAFRALTEEERRLFRTVSDILKYAGDNTYILRKRVNTGLPETCKLQPCDIRWLERHKNDTQYGRRATLINLARRYAEYLEYEYTLERDVTEEYWRRNKQWIDIIREQKALRRQNGRKATDDDIIRCYTPRIKPAETIEGYTFEVTNDPEKWRKQARVLHQCIISCQYYLTLNSTIIICTKDGAPHATFEVCHKKIVQSYKNEHDRENMRVEDACTKACIEYINNHNI